MSLGIRCFTEIYLKAMNYKNFSSPFDGLYLSSVQDVIYLLENNIEHDDLIHTQDNGNVFDEFNRKWGCRSTHKKLDNTIMKNNNSIPNQYHLATCPHHNFKEYKTVQHFKRCFERLDIISQKKIKTLFCLFAHPNYFGYVKITKQDITNLSKYLQEKFNCHLLVIFFFKTNAETKYSLLHKEENFSIYNINNNSIEYSDNCDELKGIFNTFCVDESELYNYDFFRQLHS